MGFDLRKTMSNFFTGITKGLLDWNFKFDDGATTEETRYTKRDKGYTEEHTQKWLDSVKKPKRSRTKKGK